MISIRLDENLENSLNTIAAEMDKSKSSIIREALLEYIEDKLDYLATVKALNNTKSTVSLSDVLDEFKHELRN